MPTWIAVFAAPLLKGRRAPGTDTRLFDPDFPRIRCPRCGWQPQRKDKWYCEPGCEHHWNTFETAGVCPRCTKQWEETACLSCGEWSLHERWYERGPD
jgi:hypothetical protein